MRALRQHQVMRYTFATRMYTFVTASVVASGCGASEQDNPYDLERKGTKVEVTPIYQDCEVDADCRLMDITCDICCKQDAITASLAEVFDNERMIACAEYDGPVCSCIPAPLTARCNEGACVTMPKTQARWAEADVR